MENIFLIDEMKETSYIDDSIITNVFLDEMNELKDYFNKNLKIDGLELLSKIPSNFITAAFFDPQYRGVLDKLNYGNEGKTRGKRRTDLEQMSEKIIVQFIKEIDRVLKESSYLFLWVDKFHLCEGINDWIINTNLKIVDLMVWEKNNIGMGYRTRNKCEFLLILQKKPISIKNWTIRNIPNVLKEKVNTKEHPHSKPIELQKRLIEAVSKENDIILDPAMGSGSVLKACIESKRIFIGGDLNGKD